MTASEPRKAPGVNGYIEVDGLKDFHRATRRAVDSELPKRLGQANKQIGAMVVARLNPRPDPRAVGAGAGSAVRPSASKREVLLRVGGSHRASGVHTKKQPWGKRRVARPGRNLPERPNIQGTANEHIGVIGQAWLDAVAAALSGAFYRTES